MYRFFLFVNAPRWVEMAVYKHLQGDPHALKMHIFIVFLSTQIETESKHDSIATHKHTQLNPSILTPLHSHLNPIRTCTFTNNVGPYQLWDCLKKIKHNMLASPIECKQSISDLCLNYAPLHSLLRPYKSAILGSLHIRSASQRMVLLYTISPNFTLFRLSSRHLSPLTTPLVERTYWAKRIANIPIAQSCTYENAMSTKHGHT